MNTHRTRNALLATCAAAASLALPATAVADDCPNAALRTGISAKLPDCRAYEQVSPVEKNGVNVYQGGASGAEFIADALQAAGDGDRVAFQLFGALENAPGFSKVNIYEAGRAGAGWGSSNSLVPPLDPSFDQMLRGVHAVSGDMSKTWVTTKSALAPGAVAGQVNVYLRDNDSGAYEFVATSSDPSFDDYLVNYLYLAGNEDFSTVLFPTPVALTPDATEGNMNLYRFTDGVLSLVNQPGNNANNVVSDVRANAVSRDGRRVFFNQNPTHPGGDGPLFMREGDGPIVPISVSRRDGDPTDPQDASFVGASSDGRFVVFTSPHPLTEGSAAAPFDTLGKIYRYDVETGDLIDLAPAAALRGGDTIPSVQRNIATSSTSPVSSDGSYVYFQANGRLTDDASETPSGSPYDSNLYVWRDGDLAHIAHVDGFFSTSWALSPDGSKLALLSGARFTAYDNTAADPADCLGLSGQRPDGGCLEVYLYDADDDSLVCASCDIGRPAAGHAGLGGGQGSYADTISYFKPSAVTDDGEVFFDSPSGLAASDDNGVQDVYSYRDGQVRLLTAGAGRSHSFFHGATPDGRSVFVTTGEQLVGRDRDNLIDLYTVRVGGGLASQQEPAGGSSSACEGDECQGASAVPGAAGDPATASVQGRGDRVADSRASISLGGVSRAQLARLARGRRVAVSVRVSRPGRVRLTANARIGGQRRVVGRVSRSARHAGTVRLSLRLSSVARRALKARGGLRVALVARVGGAGPVSRTLVLRRGK